MNRQAVLQSTDVDEWRAGDYATCGCCVLQIRTIKTGAKKGETQLIVTTRECQEGHGSLAINDLRDMVKDYKRPPRPHRNRRGRR